MHIYSGIHNKAIHHLPTDTDARGDPTFPVREVVLLLYVTLTRLTRTSDFHDSRSTLESVTRAYYGGNAGAAPRRDRHRLRQGRAVSLRPDGAGP